MIKGFDVSNNNGSVNFHLAKKVGGNHFCYAKVSEGNGFTDSYWVTGRPQAIRKAGMRAGGYHFVHPAANSVSSELTHFIHSFKSGGGLHKGLKADLPVCIDFEASPFRSKTDNRRWLSEFAKGVKKTTGRGCVLYGSTYFLEENLDQLPSECGVVWIASYPNLQIPNVVHRSGGRVLFHQYGANGHVPGQNGGADVDVFYGNRVQLAWFCRK